MKKKFFEIKEKTYGKVILKFLAILSFIFILITIILIDINSPAKGYEISIYSSLPKLIWIFLISSIVIGIGIICHQSFTRSKNNFWFLGFLILITVNFIILSLQFFRGYYIYSYSDPIAHLFRTSSIVSKGYFWDNYYPITHIIGAVLIEVCNLLPETVIKYLPVMFTILSIIFTYLLSTVIFSKKGYVMLSAAAGTVLLFSYYHLSVYPHGLSLLAFPLLFYLFFKSSNTQSLNMKIALLVVLFLFPFFHPTPQVIIVFCLIVSVIINWIWVKRSHLEEEVNNITFNPALISLATFFLWISYFSVFETTAKFLFKWTYGELPILLRSPEIQPVAELELKRQIEILIKMYGHNMIFIALSLIALLITTIYFFKRKRESMNIFNISILFVTSSVVYFFLFLNIAYLPWGRMLGANVGIWATPLLVGFVLYETFKKYIKTGIIISLTILSIAFIISIFSIYRSPWIYQPSWQVTQMDIKGSNWLNLNKNSEFQYAPMGWTGGYYHWYYHLPGNFGYPEYKSIGSYIPRITYIALTERFKQASSDPDLKKQLLMSPDLARTDFNIEDFDMLEQDLSVNKLYSNEEFNVFLVIPNK